MSFNIRMTALSLFGRQTIPKAIPSSSRTISCGSKVCLNDADPFGFSNPSQSLKFRKPSHLPSPSSNETHQAQKETRTATTDRPSSSLVGGEIVRRLAEKRENRLEELRQMDDRMKINREEKASLDQVWKSVSQLKVQSHFGPLAPASSRVARTVRIPPTSFLNRPVMVSDVERAYRRLQAWLNASGLRKEIYLNKRYEKPHLKRRRLRSERHRRRFAIEVQRRVQIINVMRMKGM